MYSLQTSDVFSKSKKAKIQINQQNFYDEQTNTFNTGEPSLVVQYLGEDVENPKYSFKQVEDILEYRIKELRNHLYLQNKGFSSDKKGYEEIISDAFNDVDALEKDMYFRIKGNFETIATDINEQKSLNLLHQKQITTLKKDKNESMLEINKLQMRLDEIEKILGINVKEQRDKIEKKKDNDKLPSIYQNTGNKSVK